MSTPRSLIDNGINNTTVLPLGGIVYRKKRVFTIHNTTQRLGTNIQNPLPNTSLLTGPNEHCNLKRQDSSIKQPRLIVQVFIVQVFIKYETVLLSTLKCVIKDNNNCSYKALINR
jgi:hypothetical protein